MYNRDGDFLEQYPRMDQDQLRSGNANAIGTGFDIKSGCDIVSEKNLVLTEILALSASAPAAARARQTRGPLSPRTGLNAGP
ncbi:hypothetical protein EVAR_97970_1 [Eumeta japonica]|uniref:Uncharacterized protein n=1 Tax=Eumeta variegata TaxID=151549 RepID=A0A4C1XDB0_EUMVA|nr:hypothetical protein EVAR_97970_1 [Eumeta japonica]